MDNWEDTFMDRMFKEHYSKILAEKERLISERIAEKVVSVTPFSIEIEKIRRFPRLIRVMEQETNNEYWYWNDGSVDGLLLISFFYTYNWDAETNKYSFGFNYK